MLVNFIDTGNAMCTINRCKTIFQDLCPKDRNISYLKEMKRKFCKLGLEVRNFFDTCFVFLNLLLRLRYCERIELNSIASSNHFILFLQNQTLKIVVGRYTKCKCNYYLWF